MLARIFDIVYLASVQGNYGEGITQRAIGPSRAGWGVIIVEGAEATLSPGMELNERLGWAVDRISRDGYCLVRELFDRETIQTALELVQKWDRIVVPDLPANRPNLAGEDRYILNLQNKDYFFLKMLYDKELLMGILKHFLNDPWYKRIPADKANFIFRAYNARTTTREPLRLHLDTFLPHSGKRPCVMQAVIALEDQTVTNGCTVVVPGSHLSDEYATQESYEDAVPVEYQAGDVLIFDSRIWHGTRPNETSKTRWALIATFCRWWLKQMYDIPGALPRDTYEKLTDEQKAIIGYCSVPPFDETEGMECKRGFEIFGSDTNSSNNNC